MSIALLTLVGLGLRVFRLANQSFWIDEFASIEAAQTPLDNIYDQSSKAANSLPTYFLLLKPFVGSSRVDLEVQARMISAIAGTLSVPVFIAVIYFWRRQRGTALLAGALLAVNPLHLWYSQEVRAYALMLFFGLLCFLCFELARRKQQIIWWIFYILAGLMAIALHKTGFVFAAACGLWHAWDIVRRRADFKSLLIHLPAAAATLLSMTLKTRPPLEGYGRSATGLEFGYTFLTFVGGYSFGPSVTDIQSYGPLVAIHRNMFETGILLVVLLAIAVVFIFNIRQSILGREIQLIFLSVGVVATYALFSGFPYNVRYALPALFGFLAFVAVFATPLNRSSFAQLTVGSLLAVSLWADAQWFYSWEYRKGDSRAVAQWLVENKDRVHSWSVLPDYMKSPIGWYLRPFPETLAGEIRSANDRTMAFPPVPDVLIMTRRHHLADPDKVIAAYEDLTHRAEIMSNFAGFELYVGAPQNVATNSVK